MKFIVMAFLATWMLFAQNFAFAQVVTPVKSPGKGQVSGKVLTEAKTPFDLATVALFRAQDTTLVKSSFTEQDGKYIFGGLSAGIYLLRISAMGFQNYQSQPFNVSEEGTAFIPAAITLIAATKNLKEVAITGQKAFVERKIDRTVVNVDALIGNAGTTALDVLEKSPGVQLDQNGAITLKGKPGVTIFIDGKPTYLSGADLESYLRSIPSSSLDQIELMTNPPARYDAAGQGGVINIKTKKTNSKGLNGGIILSYTQGQLARTNNSINLNYRHNRINVFGIVSQSIQNNFTDLDLYRKYKNEDGSTKSYFEQNSYIRRKRSSLNGKLGVDFYQNEQSTFGVLLTGMNTSSPETNNNVSNLLNAQRGLDSVVKALKNEKQTLKNLGVNFNYRREFDKNGHQLTFDADYLTYQTNNHQVINNSSFLPDLSQKSEDILTGKLPANIKIYSLKTDYSKPFKHNLKLDAGLKSSYTKTDNVGDYSYTIAQVTKPDYDKSNHFIYKENIYAGYLNLSKEGKRWSAQVGLRVEHTNSDGHQLGNPLKPDSAFSRNYTSLFPTAYLSYKLDTAGNNQIGLNYGRRIERPYFQELNPFVSPLDKFTYYTGNPFLDPSFVQSIELSHTFKNKITTTLSYSDSKDEVSETIQILDGLYYSKPNNIGRSIVKTISVNAGLDLTSWFTWQFYGELTNMHYKSKDFYNGVLDSKGTFFVTNNTFQFKVDKSWTAELSGTYRTKIRQAQFLIGKQYYLNAGLQKKLSVSSTLKFNVSDIFRTRITNGQINNLNLAEAGWRNRSDSRTFLLSYSYRFGKIFSDQRKHNATGAEEEKKRVSN